MSIAVKRPLPGYVTIEPYKLKRNIGGWTVAEETPDNAPDVGIVLAVGAEIKEMPYELSEVPKPGDIVVYKKYNAFKINLSKEIIMVHFENLLAVLEDTDNGKN
jgi:co-chaperonin GroES (HSP10)